MSLIHDVSLVDNKRMFESFEVAKPNQTDTKNKTVSCFDKFVFRLKNFWKSPDVKATKVDLCLSELGSEASKSSFYRQYVSFRLQGTFEESYETFSDVLAKQGLLGYTD